MSLTPKTHSNTHTHTPPPPRDATEALIVELGLNFTKVSRHPPSGAEASLANIAVYGAPGGRDPGRRWSEADEAEALALFAAQNRRLRECVLECHVTTCNAM